MLALVAPVLQTKFEAPLPDNVVDSPTHTIEGDALIVIDGDALTVTVTDAVAEHPPAFVPITEYDVVEEGLTEILAEVAPVLQT